MNILPQGPAGIGEILGQALSDVAGQWTQHRSTVKALKGLGFSDAQARSYSHLGPQVTQQAVQARQQQQQQEASNAAISQILGVGLGGNQSDMQQMNAQPQSTAYQGMPKTQLPHEQQQAAIQQATSIAQNPSFRKLNEQQQQAQALQQKQLAQGPAPATPLATPEQQAILQAQAIEAKKGEPTIKQQIEQVRNQKRALTAANLPVNQTIALHQQLENKEKELRKEAREERKETREDQREIDKETLPVYRKVSDAGKAAKQANARLKRMEHLLDKGKVQTGVLQRALRSATHIPYLGSVFSIVNNALTNRDTEEYEKLSSEFVKDAKPFFGSRMTQQEVEFYLKTVPNLLQTAPGQKRVIRNMQIFNDAAEVQQKAMNDIIRENGGRRPRDLEEQIEARTRNDLDALHREFIGGPTGLAA